MVRWGKQLAWLIIFLSFIISFVGCTLPERDFEPKETIFVTDVPTEEATTDSGEVSTPTPVPAATQMSIATPVPTPAPTVQPTVTAQLVSTPKPIAVPSSNLTPTKTPIAAPTATATPVPTNKPTSTPGGSGTVTQAEVYCRNTLTQSQQSAYDTLVAGFSDPSKIQTAVVNNETVHLIKVGVNYKASTDLESELQLILSAIFMDHPELYYLSKSYSFSYWNNRLTEVRMHTIDRTSALSLQAQVESGIAAYQQKVSPDQDQYEIAKQYYELLATNIQYVQDGTDYVYSIVGAFVNGQCVCEGFSEAYQLLLNAYGIRAFTVSGEAGGAHQWIAVEINGKWYYSDPTWGNLKTYGETDSYPKDGYVRVNYAYLNLNETMMGTDHTLDAISSAITANLDFTATQDNFFVREGGYFQEFQKNAVEAYIKQEIADAIANQRETVGIRMGSAQAYDTLIDYIYHNLYRVYYETGGQTASLSYYTNETTYTVHISMQ